MINQETITAAHHINNTLLPAEASSKNAAITSAELLVTMLRQHDAGGFDDSLGLSAIDEAQHAAALAVQLRKAHIRVHGFLNRDVKRAGLEMMYGKGKPLPDNQSTWPMFTGATLSPATVEAA